MNCIRCKGLLITNHGETYCANCSHRPEAFKPFVLPVVVHDRCRYCQRKTLSENRVCWYHKQYHIEYKRKQHLEELREAKRRKKEELCVY